MNVYIRFKLALTEDNPTIRAYNEDAWVEAAGRGEKSRSRRPSCCSRRCTNGGSRCWESMKQEDFTRPLVHPEIGPVTLDRMLQTYAWHGAHHTAHITGLRARQGW